MIIRMNLYKTLKASTRNNRAVRSTPGDEPTLKESPSCVVGHAFSVLSAMAPVRRSYVHCGY